MASTSNSPGWYPDPDGGAGERWWNGVGWSDARRGVAPPSAAPVVPSAGSTTPAPVIYSASNPAPQHPGHYVAPGSAGYVPKAAVTVQASANPMAVYAFIAGLISVFFNVLLVPGILAIVFGARGIARSNQVRAAGQPDSTRALAVVGLVLGIVGGVWGLLSGLIFIAGFLPLFFVGS